MDLTQPSNSDYPLQSYNDIITTLQHHTQEAEQRNNYIQSLSLCWEACHQLEKIDFHLLNDEEKLELRFHHSQTLNRIQYLSSILHLSAKRFETSLKTGAVECMTSLKNSFSDSIIINDLNKQNKYQPKDDYVNSSTDEEFSEITSNQTDKQNKSPTNPLRGMSKELKLIRHEIEQGFLKERPSLKFKDIIGLEEAKLSMLEAIAVPILYAGEPQAQNCWSGILLYGPPGVGKTRLVEALAGETDHAFVKVQVSTLLSKWTGQTEKRVKTLFDLAREKSPSIIFIDECEGLFSQRNEQSSEMATRAKNILLEEMDGFGKNSPNRVLVIGNTNKPRLLDDAFIRRFKKRIFVDLPTAKERVQLIQYFLKGYKCELSADDVNTIATHTDRFSGSDIHTLVSEAGILQSRELLKQNLQSTNLLLKANKFKVRPINMLDFRQGLHEVVATTTSKQMLELELYQNTWGKPKRYSDLGPSVKRKKDSTIFKSFSLVNDFLHSR